MFRQIACVLLGTCFLASCQNEVSVSDLMQHPERLKREVDRCDALREKTKDQAQRCEVVLYAASNFISFINSQQSDPQEFGQKILEAQINVAKIKTELEAAKSSASDKQNADKMKALEDQYRAAQNEVKVLLAVAGLSSPE